MAAGELSHIAVYQVETGGENDVDPHEHQHGKSVEANGLFVGEVRDHTTNEYKEQVNRVALQNWLHSLPLISWWFWRCRKDLSA